MNNLASTNDHLLVAIPERFMAPKGPRSPEGLAISLILGEDAMAELEVQIRNGGQLQIETETDTSIKNLVRTGQVLAIPPQLTDQMVLCAAGDGLRTFADITPVVEVGDTVFLDWSVLIPDSSGENPNEILPGIYRVPYSAVICVIEENAFLVEAGKLMNWLAPVGGYVLLSRVWDSEVVDYEVDGVMRKVRFGKDGYLIDQIDVAPLANEGQVAWVDAPLKGALNELHPGQRVVFDPRQALIEVIAGTEYLCVRHDYVLMAEQPKWAPKEEWEKGIAHKKALAVQPRIDGEEVHNISYAHPNPHTLTISAEEVGDGEWLKRAGYHLPTFLANQNPFTKEFQKLPLHLPNYLA